MGGQGVPLSITGQLKTVLGRNDGKADADALYIVWAGGNDYLQGSTDSVGVANAVLEQVAALLDGGARAVLVLDMLKLSDLPPDGVSEGAADEALDAVVARHNERIGAGVDELRASNPRARIALGSPQRLRDDVKQHPTDFGLTDTKSACYQKGLFVWDGSVRDRCAEPAKHFYLDNVHPTTRVHCSFAVTALEALVAVDILHAPIDEAAARERCMHAPAAF